MGFEFKSNKVSSFHNFIKQRISQRWYADAVAEAGNHWYTMGLVSKSQARKYLETRFYKTVNSEISFGTRRHLRPWHLPSFSAIQLIRSIHSLRFGSIETDYVRDTGDFYGLFGSTAVWLYLHVATIILTTFEIAFPLLIKFIGRLDWLQTFGHMRRKASLDKLCISDNNALRRFLLASRFGFRLLDFSPYFFIGTFTAMFLPGYVYRFGFGWQVLFICLPSLAVFLAFMTNNVTAFITPVAYFSLYAYYVYVSIRLRLQNRYWLKTLAFLKKFQNVKAKRQALHATVTTDEACSERKRYSKERVEQLCTLLKTECQKRIAKGLSSHDAILADIGLCDRFYNRLLLIVLPSMYFTVLSLIYGLTISESWMETVFFLFANAGPFNISVLYFLMSSLTMAQLKRSYVSLTRVSPVYVDFSTNWRLSGAIEKLASKKFKPGFRCAHLFLLTRFNMFKVRQEYLLILIYRNLFFIKVMMATSSLFFMMVQFGREMN